MKGHADELRFIERMKKGDQEAFESLYNIYWEMLFVIAYNRLESVEVAREIVQDVFTDLWIKKERLRIDTSIKSYLLTAVKYTVIDHIRKSTHREKYINYMLRYNNKQHEATEEIIYLNDLQAALNREISSLPEKCREIFELSRFKNQTNKEIAHKMNISPKTVENQIFKALSVLRKNLKDYLTLLFF